MKWFIVGVSLIVTFVCFAEPLPDLYAGPADTTSISLDVGIELSELMQNSFSNIGFNNFTVLLGQQLWVEQWNMFGWRLIAMNVQLSSEHLADPNAVTGLDGNRIDLSGSFFALRFYFDWYTVLLKAWFIKVIPIISAGVGFQHTIIKNPRYPQADYDIMAVPVALAARLHFTILNYIWIGMPFMEFSFNAWHTTPTKELGDLTITRPDWFNMYGWLSLGISIPLHKPSN